MNEEQPWHNYSVSFSDFRAKTGVTSRPFHRLQDYIQEAHRHDLKIDGFRITPPASNKATALRIEAMLCERFSHHAVDGHREWFFDDISWCRPFKAKHQNRRGAYEDLESILIDVWKEHHKFTYAQDCLRLFGPMMALAADLGKCGDRISATRAAAISHTIMRREAAA